MGMQVEFNWYLVLKEEPLILDEGIWNEEDFIQTGMYYRTTKSEARVYPIGGVVPLVIDNQAVGLAHIRECSHRLDAKNKVFTVIDYDMILEFEEKDPIGLHYTDMYLAYKKKQEIEDHGGKFKPQDFANAITRRRFESALEKLGE